jgi:hypothetical protein
MFRQMHLHQFATKEESVRYVVIDNTEPKLLAEDLRLAMATAFGCFFLFDAAESATACAVVLISVLCALAYRRQVFSPSTLWSALHARSPENIFAAA